MVCAATNSSFANGTNISKPCVAAVPPQFIPDLVTAPLVRSRTSLDSDSRFSAFSPAKMHFIVHI